MSLGMNSMNGAQGIPSLTSDTPLAYYQPIAITPAIIKWMVGGLIGGIWSLYAAGWLFMPAKQAELADLRQLVQIVQKNQTDTAMAVERISNDTRMAVERLTMAVDNIAGLVSEVRTATGKLKNAVPTLKVR